jgi:sugar/nucleoside kinase (ribokinase family)
MNNTDKPIVAGIGSVLMDILVNEDEHFLEKSGAVKGGMTYVDPEFIEKTVSMASGQPSIVPGGSACNTIIGVARLGGQARFVGKSGSGRMARQFETDLKNSNVEPLIFKSSNSTGRVLSIITPDAQRSMLTYLGAASEIRPDEITETCFSGAAIVHVEGYLLFNKDLIVSALKAAKSVGAKISLDLASFTVVDAAKSFLDEMVKDYVDILIANEDEARAFTGYSHETDAIRALSDKADISVLKVGERGSFIAQNGQVLKIEPAGSGTAVDTTGAGDLWASGFLYGLAHGYSLEKSGTLGSLCGYEVCRVVGAKIPEDGWQRIRIAVQ